MANEIQNEILGSHTGVKLAVDAQLERFGLVLQQGLRRQHVLDFTRANAEGQRAESAVRRSVAVAANDRHARLRIAQLRPDHVHDSLPRIIQIVMGNAELVAVVAQRVDLFLRDHVNDRQAAVGGGHIVVGRGHSLLRPADAATGLPQPREGLRTGYLVHEVQVDIKNRLATFLGKDDVLVPDFSK